MQNSNVADFWFTRLFLAAVLINWSEQGRRRRPVRGRQFWSSFPSCSLLENHQGSKKTERVHGPSLSSPAR